MAACFRPSSSRRVSTCSQDGTSSSTGAGEGSSSSSDGPSEAAGGSGGEPAGAARPLEAAGGSAGGPTGAAGPSGAAGGSGHWGVQQGPPGGHWWEGRAANWSLPPGIPLSVLRPRQ